MKKNFIRLRNRTRARGLAALKGKSKVTLRLTGKK